jgi:hypothetical protein
LRTRRRFVIVVRHGATHSYQADTDPLNVDQPGNEAKQRQLSDKGRATARAWDEAFRKMAATPPDPGTNTIIVSHKPNVVDAFGKDWFEVKEGEASVFKPDGQGGYQPVGRVLAEQWPELAARYPK